MCVKGIIPHSVLHLFIHFLDDDDDEVEPKGMKKIDALPYSTHSAIKVLMLLPYMSGNIKVCPHSSSC